MIIVAHESGYGWLRLWRGGPGVAWKPAGAPMNYSQRNGCVMSWCAFGRRWKFLGRDKK